MHVNFSITRYIREVYLQYTNIYLQYEHQKSNTYFFKPQPKVYVFGMYLQVFCSYIVSILFVFQNICTYCTYMHITMQVATFRAFCTYKYVQYVHILSRILAYTYTKYVSNTCKYIRS